MMEQPIVGLADRSAYLAEAERTMDASLASFLTATSEKAVAVVLAASVLRARA
mgnify:CR=1 FL=1